MKKFIFSALIALSTLSSSQAANLYSSNLGNGVSLSDAIVGIPSGTVRFGVFPDGFDFNANVENFANLDAAFIEVASFSGDLSVNATDGFYQSAISYDTSISYEDQPYASAIAGKKVYIWVLNSLVPEEVTQQMIVSTNQTWVAADAVIADTFATPDTGAAGLTFHVGSNALGNNIGAGANSHVLGGAQTAITSVVITAAPSATVDQGTNVTITAATDGSGPKTYVWFKNGVVIEGQSSSSLALGATDADDTAVYYVEVTNNVTESFASNELAVTVNTLKPTIVTQPTSTVIAEGGELNLNVVAVAQGTLLYQWKKGADIAGQTGSSLFLPNLSLAQAGSYTVALSNLPTSGGGKLTSAKAEVVVVSQATNTVISAVGAKATLTALISGKGASLQWFKEGSIEPLLDGADYSGVTKNKLGVLRVDGEDSGDYYCVATVGDVSVESGRQTLNVYTAAPELDETLTGLPAMPDGQIGSTYEYQIPVLGDASQAPLTYAAKGLPTGLKLNTKTGFITGRPTKATNGDVIVTFTVKNRIGSDVGTASIAILASEELAELAGSYVGPIDRNTESSIYEADLGGRFEMTITSLGAISGKLYLGSSTLPLKGFIELGGALPSTELVVLRKGGLPPLNIGIEIDGDLIFGFVSDTAIGSDMVFDGYKNIYHRTNNPASDYEAVYNIAMGLAEGNPNIGDLSIPQGAGYGSFKVAADGKLSVKGKTADGEAYTTSSFVGPSGEVFLFQTIYKTKTKGSIHGRMTIDSGDDNTIAGTATQLRRVDPSSRQRTYAAGFDLTDSDNGLSILGGAYTPPTGVLLDQAENAIAQLTFENGVGPVAAEAEVGVKLLAKNRLSIEGANPAKTRISINAKTGLILGSFTLSADRRPGKFTGVVVPEGNKLIGLGSLLLPESSDRTSEIRSSQMELDAGAPPPPPHCDL